MKQSKFLKRSLFAFLLAGASMTNAQDVTADFSWTNTTGATFSSGEITGCGGSVVDVNMTSVTLGHELTGGTGAYLPENPNDGGNVTVTINFAPAVLDLSILMNDFDEHAPGAVDDGSPSEFGSGFAPAFTSISPVVGSPTFVATGGGTGVDPAGAENTKGWVNWTGPISTVTFTYARPDAGVGAGGWGLILDAMTFNCEDELTCACSEGNKFNKIGKVLANGQTSSEIQVNSGGIAVSKLNISIPFWESLVDPSCLDCDTRAMLNAGKITNLPTIAGVTPTFAGPGGSASEIVYEFPTPTVINQAINVEMQFPAVLALACCINRVDYCIKIQMITEKCEVCETTICISDKKAGKAPAVKAPTTAVKVSTNVDFQEAVVNTIAVSPNPAAEFVNIALPVAQGVVYVYTMEGQLVNQMNVNNQNIRLDIQAMNSGSYIVKHVYDNEVITSKFVIE